MFFTYISTYNVLIKVVLATVDVLPSVSWLQHLILVQFLFNVFMLNISVCLSYTFKLFLWPFKRGSDSHLHEY